MSNAISGRIVILLGLAGVWGLSEATFFFIVPDVVISLIALQYGWRAGFLSACLAALGAMLGGALVYVWGQNDIASARTFFDMLPAIAPTTITRAGNDVVQSMYGLSILKGSVTGVPFKLYAAEAGHVGLPLWVFLGLTPLVRLPRFLFAASLAAVAGKMTPKILPSTKLAVLVGFWIVFYAIYWLNAAW